MNRNRDAIDASYRYCRQVSRRAGSSFHAGFILLPAEKRKAMWALYAFMRHTDDLIDDPPGDVSPRDALAEWREALSRALNDCLTPPDNSSFVIRHSSLLPALADAVKRYNVPAEHLYAVIEGVEMDLEPRRYETFDDLQHYCQRVASAVGLACIHIWGFRDAGAFEPARAAGIALQLTNILRDQREDAARGRLYLPEEDLRQCGYSFDELRSGVINEPFLRLMELEIERARGYYRTAVGLFDQLSPAGRRIFGAMTATYRKLLARIERRPAEVLRGRVRVGPAAKLMILARWSLLPSWTTNPF
ncbi:MAG: phytoene/squalene synthase family protein [Pirellulales bacterium]|nr:phytoene/squalene synthase family protein [Pirellulales bacterium]